MRTTEYLARDYSDQYAHAAALVLDVYTRRDDSLDEDPIAVYAGLIKGVLEAYGSKEK